MSYDGNCHLGDLFSSRREKGREGLPTLSVTLNNGLVNRDDLERKQETTLTADEHLLVKPNDIAYNMMRMWQGAFGLAEKEGLVSPAYVVLKQKPTVDPAFASQLFKTKRMLYLFWAYSHGLTEDRLRLYAQDFARIPVNVPSIAEQSKIAEMLEAWDQAVETIEKLIENSAAHKTALMDRFFSKYESFHLAAGEWHYMALGDLADIDAESLGKTTPADFQFRYITLSDVNEHHVSQSLATYRLSEAPSRARRVVRPGDLLMSTVRPNLQGFARVTRAHADCIASTGFAVLTAKSGTSSDYLFHYLFSRHIQDQINAIVIGSSYPSINSSDVERLLVRCPPLEQQLTIAKILDTADERIQAEIQQRDLLIRQKQALMQQLLAGKRRVKSDQPDMAAA
ncbi:restriction endonuclease subunit S [Collimonas silvisoli]|uniref:restriction endonuclease subunit S n=1 Tax=Collimonas silvisoli TaxID=2825884 RepID=UPI001B8BAC18|nr:restriction endonuclease subunit S [Collimonas silvisoli]